MAGSLNRVELIGHLGADPEVRFSQQSVKVVNMRLATSESYTKNGEKKEFTDWHTVVIFGRHDGDSIADVAEKYLKKGSKVFVSGKLKTRKWQDQSGNDRYSTEVVLQPFDSTLILLDSREGGNRPPPPSGADDYGSSSSRPGKGGGSAPRSPDPDDDIPFGPEWR